MNKNTTVELHFDDDGTIAFGALGSLSARSASIRLIERAGSEVFAYGRAGRLVYEKDDGLVSQECRLVAQYDGSSAQELMLAIVGEPISMHSKTCESVRCCLDVDFRAVHAGGSFGAWRRATAVEIGREQVSLLIEDSGAVAETVELRIALPHSMRRSTAGEARTVKIVRGGTSRMPENERPIRLRGGRAKVLRSGESVVATIDYHGIPPSVAERFEELLVHLDVPKPHPLVEPAAAAEEDVVQALEGLPGVHAPDDGLDFLIEDLSPPIHSEPPTESNVLQTGGRTAVDDGLCDLTSSTLAVARAFSRSTAASSQLWLSAA
jgi:hypothetical protein